MKLELIDTHCHIHDSEFADKFKPDRSQDGLLIDAADVGVRTVICVGTDLRSSREAVDFCNSREGCHSTVALHPHEAADKDMDTLRVEVDALADLIESAKKPVVAVGECGLDYYYHAETDTRQKQQQALRWHLDLSRRFDLPLVFHVRDAFDDFIDILDEYPDTRGVVHSFSATEAELEKVLSHGLYVGLNGIMTFSKDPAQLQAARAVPLNRLVLETDAPFLTPNPLRGRMNEPKNVILITQFLSELRGESREILAKATTENATKLFSL